MTRTLLLALLTGCTISVPQHDATPDVRLDKATPEDTHEVHLRWRALDPAQKQELLGGQEGEPLIGGQEGEPLIGGQEGEPVIGGQEGEPVLPPPPAAPTTADPDSFDSIDLEADDDGVRDDASGPDPDNGFQSADTADTGDID